MLIDATHPEETRVVVTRGNRVEEFDYESATRKQLRGNIYLAKVARIEPSLQAAFVNYGGNRHGFLAFAEIHPDYYQIPVAVREAIMKEEALDRQKARERGDGADHETNSNGESSAFSDHGGDLSTNGHSRAPNHEPAGEASSSGEPSAEVPASIEAAQRAATESAAESGTAPRDEGTAERKKRDQPIPLEAALPPVLYEKFTAAVELAEEARDEIPAHPDDVEGLPSAEPGGDASHAGAASPASHAQPEFSVEINHRSEAEQGQTPGGEGSVTSVPEIALPAPIELAGTEDALEELPQRHKRRWRHYKIQEVIKRNQILLIQVVKEERGTKGAALTTYLSLAGRYTVLMPNTPSGGGISRKITVPADRKRLKEIAQELEVPEGMGLIIRTAGASRTKAEIKRDFEYLLRLWENVRDLTLNSTAPCLVYEEGNLIKRSIRDLYNKDIDEIIVAGDDAHREAKEFMRMLMPSHAKNVIQHREPEPLFIRYEVERQLNQMFSPVVTLRSGGYIVLNQTEALVAIDVNSGRSTREYSIEDTALKTNMEAAEEVARQVRLRDLAGLIVIDFIDMDERRNNRAVERKLKDALRNDRARIQVGHISHFGLLEMSRQRLRQGVVEVSTMPCPVCQGMGHVRSTESVALMILRSIEDHLRTQGPADLTANASTEASLYILNHKRAYLRDIELRYGVTIVIQMDETVHGGTFALTRGATANAPAVAESKAIQMEPSHLAVAGEADEETVAEGDDRRPSRRKRRRRRGRGDLPAGHGMQNGAGSNGFEASGEDEPGEDDEEDDSPEGGRPEPAAIAGEVAANKDEDEGAFRRNRRRGRRGGRRHRDEAAYGTSVPGLGEQPDIAYDLNFPGRPPLGPIQQDQVSTDPLAQAAPQISSHVPDVTPLEHGVAAIAEPRGPGRVNRPLEAPEPKAAETAPAEPVSAAAAAVEPEPAEAVSEPAAVVEQPKHKPARTGPARKGWWQRSIG